ncbi:glycerol-3-phosphate acyltransferase [Thecamonas trahens ATCC 50062]|uniref:Glycerol-3-phosphate acyltransferase n=1 Tax=Thecamonas trahens ATCC 50062 TaxID=461836 RepID=A0A0L0DA21_THETB|nr:glycerol-3-phosphate acyltransferase [Thecamonas trahens ATCC 50062]KNC49199.1 glycerol-3-phosphate acyltransferase [Thecamonas trahens ATCC 50062]|eukprot:XP_013758215.1 glycerol-3-phosphate acyltransferase [Thecamonas trahens ATCC 50062]
MPEASDGFVAAWGKALMPDVWWVCARAELRRSERECGEFANMAEDVAGDEAVLAQAGTLARDEYKARVRDILGQLTAEQAPWLQRVVLLCTLKVLRLLYASGIFVDVEDVRRVVREMEARPKAALLLLPTHRSAIDYVLVWYMCVVCRLPLPYMVAESKHLERSWLKALLVYIFRSLGSIFPDHAALESDPLYGAVYASYMRNLIGRGATLQCFIEGSRSRTGKSKRPQLGLTSFLVDAVQSNKELDAVVTCIGLGHARVIENALFVNELVGDEAGAQAAAAREHLDLEGLAFATTLLSRILRRQFSLGSVDMGMAAPFSLREFVRRQWQTDEGVFGFCGVRASAIDVPRLSRASSPTRSLEFARVAPAPVDASEPGREAGDAAWVAAAVGSSSTESSVSDDDNGAFTDMSSIAGGGNGDESRKGSPEAGLVVDVALSPTKTQFASELVGRLQRLVPAAGVPIASRVPSLGSPVKILHESGSAWQAPHVGRGALMLPSRSSRQILTPRSAGVAAAAAPRAHAVSLALTHNVMYLCNSASVVVPSAVVGTILLTHYKRGLALKDLAQCVTWLRNEVRKRGFRVAARARGSFESDVAQLVNRVLSSRDSGSSNEMVKKFRGDTLLFGLYTPEERMLLVFYRNQLMHVFVPEALVCAALYALERKRGEFPARVSGRDLRRYTHFLVQLFRFEFAFPPSSFHRDTFSETVESLVQRRILVRSAVGEPGEIDSDMFSVDSRDDDSLVESTFVSHGTGMYLFLCSLLWPFLDSYFLCALGLFALLEPAGGQRPPVEVSAFVAHVQKNVGEAVFFGGQLDLYEAISRDTLINAAKLYARWGVVRIADGHISLADEFASDGEVSRFARRIAAFKKRSRSYSSRRYRTRRGVRSAVADAESHARNVAPLLWGGEPMTSL